MNIDIYDGTGLLALKGVVVVDGGLLHIYLLTCVHKYTDIYRAIGFMIIKEVMVIERWDLLCIHLHINLHLYLNCVKNTDIYDGISLLALKVGSGG